jgi:hypothetical protein
MQSPFHRNVDWSDIYGHDTHRGPVSAANVADKEALPHLLHGKERRVWGDQAYRGQSEVLARVAPMAQDLTNQAFRYRGRSDDSICEANRLKSKVRARVEHVFGTIKRVFGSARFASADCSRTVIMCACWRRLRTCSP